MGIEEYTLDPNYEYKEVSFTFLSEELAASAGKLSPMSEAVMKLIAEGWEFYEIVKSPLLVEIRRCRRLKK